MANDINSVIVTGRLTRDAEIRYSNNGFAISKFSIASNYSKKVGDNWETEANFFDAVLLGKRAESLNQYLTKGTQLIIKGEVRQNRWEQDGQKRSKVELIANDIQLLGGKQAGGNPQGSQGNSNAGFKDDIPF